MSENISQGMTVGSILAMLKAMVRRWYVFLICMLLCAPVGALVGYVTYEPLYRIQSILVVGGKDDLAGKSEPGLNGATQYKSLATSFSELLSSQQVEDAIRKSVSFDISASQLFSALDVSLKEETAVITIAVYWDDLEELQELHATVQDVFNLMLYRTWGLQYTWISEYSTPADVAGLPIMTRTKLFGVIGAFGGVLIAAVIISIHRFTNQKIDGIDAFSDKTGLVVLGQLPKRKQALGRTQKTEAQYRYRIDVLDARILLAKEGVYRRIFLISLGKQSQGRLVGADMAAGFARAGKRVLLVDLSSYAVVTKPKKQRRRNKPQEGMYDAYPPEQSNDVYSDGEMELSSNGYYRLTRRFGEDETTHDYLNFTEALHHQAVAQKLDYIEKLISSCENEYDLVLTVSPDVSKYEEWALSTKHADMNLLLLNRDQAKVNEVNRLHEELAHNDVKLHGCIIANLRTRDFRHS